MYYDDVEVCNPLGSRAKTHKLGMSDKQLFHEMTKIFFFLIAIFYYSLGNISPAYRSMLRCIQLLTITKSSTLQQYGANCILEEVMKDIKKLESVSYVLG